MKKFMLCTICVTLASSIFLTGCSMNKIINPTTDETSMFYDTITTISNDDIKSNKYMDLFMDQNLTPSATKDFIKKHETRTIDNEEVLSLSYFPGCSAEDQLGTWIRSCKVEYTFADPDNSGAATTTTTTGVSSYKLTSKNSNCTYSDYLYIMRAMTSKYGECTTELYKNGSNVISISDIQHDMSEAQIIQYFNKLFEDGELSVVARWKEKTHSATVNFASPSECSVEYKLD